MKALKQIAILLFVVLALPRCFGTEDTNVIALGAWSDPVGNNDGYTLRGRLLMCEYSRRGGSGPASGSDFGVYLELQEFSDFIGETHVYCDFTKGLKCHVSDESNRTLPDSGFAFSGGAPNPQWIFLPPYSSVRLRATVFGGGKLHDGSLGLWFMGAGTWTIKAADTNIYFLSGALTVNPPTNNFNPTHVWSGTLKLPKIRIPSTQP